MRFELIPLHLSGEHLKNIRQMLIRKKQEKQDQQDIPEIEEKERYKTLAAI